MEIKLIIREKEICHISLREVVCKDVEEQASDDYIGLLKTLTDIGISLGTNGSYVLQVGEHHLGELLRSLKHFGFKVAVIWAEGSWSDDPDIDKEILKSVKEWDKEEWGAAGHILDRPLYKEPKFHHQCVVLNLRKLTEIIECPLWEHDASNKHMHDDYTPMWIKVRSPAKIVKHTARNGEINVFDKILRTCLENKLTVFNLDYNIRGKKICVYPEDDIEWAEEKVFANLDQLPQKQLVRIMSDVRINYPDKIAMFEFKIQSVTNLYITNTETVPHVVDNDLQVAVCPCSGLHQFKFIQPSLDVMEKVIWADYSPYAVKWMEILVHEWNGKDFHTFFDNNKDRLNYDGSVINGHGTWEKFLESFENEDEWLTAWAKIRNLEHQFIDVNLVNDYNKVVELIPPNKNVLLQCSNIFLYESNYFNRGPLTAVNSIDYVKQVRNISNKVIFNGDINGSYYDMINTNRLKWI